MPGVDSGRPLAPVSCPHTTEGTLCLFWDRPPCLFLTRCVHSTPTVTKHLHAVCLYPTMPSILRVRRGASRSLSRPKSGRRDSPCLFTCNAVANIPLQSSPESIKSYQSGAVDTTAVCVRYDNLLLCLNLQCVAGLSRVEMSAGAASSSGAAAASAPVAPPRVRGLEGQLGNNDHLAMYLCLFLTVSTGGPQEGWRSMR